MKGQNTNSSKNNIPDSLSYEGNNIQNNHIMNGSNSNISTINNNSSGGFLSSINEDIYTIIHHLQENEFTSDNTNNNNILNNFPLYDIDTNNVYSEIFININNKENSVKSKSNK